MPTFKLPLSGDVVQSINPFAAFMTGGQFGLININMGQSSEPDVEGGMVTTITFTDLGDGRTEVVTHQTNVPFMYAGPEARKGFETSLRRFGDYIAELTAG